MIDTKELQQENNKQYKKKQREILDSFYAEYVDWKMGTMGQRIDVLLIGIVLGTCLCIPYQMIQKLESGYIFVLVCMGILIVTNYIQPYMQYKEEEKMIRIYEKLKYLPISLQQLRVYRLKKITRFCFKMFVVIFAAQIFFAFISYHEICWGNIWYPTVFGLLVPVGCGLVFCGAK